MELIAFLPYLFQASLLIFINSLSLLMTVSVSDGEISLQNWLAQGKLNELKKKKILFLETFTTDDYFL